MLKPNMTTKFKRDWKKIIKRGHNINELIEIMRKLEKEEVPLPEKYRDHSLTGNKAGYRECHINPDWLLIYYYHDECNDTYIDENGEEKNYNGGIVFISTGTHSDLKL